MDVLPFEIQHKILRRLPNIKTIAAARRVCRDWNEFIDSYFEHIGFDIVALKYDARVEEFWTHSINLWREPAALRFDDSGKYRDHNPEGVFQREVSWVWIMATDPEIEFIPPKATEQLIDLMGIDELMATAAQAHVICFDVFACLKMSTEDLRKICAALPQANHFTTSNIDFKCEFLSEETFAVLLAEFASYSKINLDNYCIPETLSYLALFEDVHRKGQINEFIIAVLLTEQCSKEEIKEKIDEAELNCPKQSMSALRIDAYENVKEVTELNPAKKCSVGEPLLMFARVFVDSEKRQGKGVVKELIFVVYLRSYRSEYLRNFWKDNFVTHFLPSYTVSQCTFVCPLE